MKAFLSALVAGLLLGLGLSISSMTNPQKVLNFLDITGVWDASLLLVLGTAVGVTFLGYWMTQSMRRPLFADRFQFPHKTEIDFHLIVGPMAFGIGWGIGGVCPGPGLELAITAPGTAIWFIPPLLVGLWIGRPFHRAKRAQAKARAEAAQPS